VVLVCELLVDHHRMRISRSPRVTREDLDPVGAHPGRVVGTGQDQDLSGGGLAARREQVSGIEDNLVGGLGTG
jgi:hypothetical protein